MTAIHQRVDEVFLDLVLDDSDLLRAEFEGLIADCWETPCQPPRRKLCPPVGGWAAPPPAGRPGRPDQPVADTFATRPPEARQRGPPR
jgi:hypothetical protein